MLAQSAVSSTLPEIKHGVERETLRINTNGSLAQTPHPHGLGSALTHEFITTDFSESLLEFITPPESDPNKTLAQLKDIHKNVMTHMGEEMLWPLSMPCFVKSDEQIPIANYGTSNIGKMKSLYRIGLKNRYGSAMQAISGVHFNFSYSDTFWKAWLEETTGKKATKDNISDAYFALIRNYRRFCWLIPYLFGASPALCSSFIKGKKTNLPFQELGKGTLYLPYATSLRMSDLGYTNSEQSDLSICYNEVDSYINSVRKAIKTPSEKYKAFEGKKDGQYQQLNSNVLQIENELYSPIRPKQPTSPLEKPTDALEDRGVNYIEVRALDVNPFSSVGIEKEQFYFLDVFLTYCLVAPSAMMTDEQYQETENNLSAVVVNGRDPQLLLNNQFEPVSIPTWANNIFEKMREIAAVLDNANSTSLYSEAVDSQWQKIVDPAKTPSAVILSTLLSENKDNGQLGMELAEKYKAELLSGKFKLFNETQFVELAETSRKLQLEKEQADILSFDEFLIDYFKN